MDMQDVQALCEQRGLSYKGEYLNGLEKEEFNAGMRKVNLPDSDNIHSGNGEGVWAWVKPEDRAKYDDDNCNEEIDVVLANSPLNYMGILFWGSEIRVKCHGGNRPTLSPGWVQEKIINAEWYIAG